MILCYSMNAGSVVGTLRDLGDIQILLPAKTEFIQIFCTQEVVGDA